MITLEQILEDLYELIEATEAYKEFYGEYTYKGENAVRKLDILVPAYHLLEKLRED